MAATSVQMMQLPWPRRALPTITAAARFPLDDRQFDTTYQTKTHALHLHGYRGTFRLDDKEQAILPGDLTLSPAKLPSAYDLPTPGHHLCIHFKPVPARSATVRLPVHLRLGSQEGFVAEKMLHIARLFAASAGRSARSGIAASAASAAMQELLLQIAMLAQPEPAGRLTQRRSHAAVERAAAIVQERLAQPLSISSLAGEVGLSQNYLARQFHQRFGMTIKRFLLQRRMERAQQLLVATNMPIWRIGQLVGLPDPQYLNKLFRRCTGRCPSDVRR